MNFYFHFYCDSLCFFKIFIFSKQLRKQIKNYNWNDITRFVGFVTVQNFLLAFLISMTWTDFRWNSLLIIATRTNKNRTMCVDHMYNRFFELLSSFKISFEFISCHFNKCKRHDKKKCFFSYFVVFLLSFSLKLNYF